MNSFNPFIAVLIAPSIEKQPTEVPNLNEIMKALPPLRLEKERTLPKCTVLKVELLQAHQVCCLQRVCVHVSALKIYELGEVKGLKGIAYALVVKSTRHTSLVHQNGAARYSLYACFYCHSFISLSAD